MQGKTEEDRNAYKRGKRCSKQKTPLLQLAQTTEGAVAKLLTGSRKHALELANPLRSFMPIPTEGRFQRLLHQFVLYDSTTVANIHPLLLQQLTESLAQYAAPLDAPGVSM
jgi:hypothetical protein